MTTPKKGAKPSFEDFIAANPMPVSRGGHAWIETIPEFEDVKALFRAGHPGSEIRWWLIEGRGYTKTQATTNTVDGWLNKHVERDC